MATRLIDPAASCAVESVGVKLKALIQKRFKRSLSIRQVDTGSCGACVSEIISACNPLYDLGRFGVQFVASPRHADCLLVTGPVSKNMALALKKTYEACPEPKFVITCGDCGLHAGMFAGSYYVQEQVQDIVPVALHIPGCPPSPLVIIQALLAFLKS